MSASEENRNLSRQFVRGGVGVAFALGVCHSWAQDTQSIAAPPGTPVPDKPKATELQKIAVDAEELVSSSPKLTAPLVDTPMSVTILPQSVMQETAAMSLQDALRNVPGITFAAGEGGTPTGDLPSIRGFNASGNVYVDGMRDIGVQSRDIFALEQIEVIKGPDSSIAGRSAGGGSINLVSKTAQANDFIETSGSYGSAGQYRAALDANVKITDGIAARLNFMDMGGGVPGRNSAVRTNKWGIDPTITFGLASSTRVILNYYHFEDKSTPDYGIPVDYNVTGLPLAQTQGISTENYYGLVDRDFRKAPVDSGEVRVEHDIGDALTLRSQARYTVSKNDYVLTLPYQATTPDYVIEPGLVYRLPIANADETRGIISGTDLFGHFDTGWLRHDIDVGFEYSLERERLADGNSWQGYTVVSPQGLQGYNGGGCSSALLASYDCTSLFNPNPNDPWAGTVTLSSDTAYYSTHDLAPYAFDTLTLTPHWKINAGVRWDKYRTVANDPTEGYDIPDSMSFASYQGSLMFKPIESGTLYFTASSAAIPEDEAFSNAGQDEAFPASPYNPASNGFKPERTRSYELGTKWNLFNNQLMLSGDVFDEKHYDTAIEVAPSVYAQLGETKSRGVELSANGSMTPDWNLNGGYSFVDAHIVTGGIYAEPGDQLPNTPKSTFSLWSTYRIIPTVTAGGGAYYRGPLIGYAGPPDDKVSGYWRFDTMAKWQVDPRVSVQLNLQNLFDRQYYSKTFYWYALPAAGRTWMITADVKL